MFKQNIERLSSFLEMVKNREEYKGIYFKQWEKKEKSGVEEKSVAKNVQDRHQLNQG